MFPYLLNQIPIIADDDHPVTAGPELTTKRLVRGFLARFIVDAAIAENANVGGGEEIRNTARLGDRFLGLVRQPITVHCQHIEHRQEQFALGGVPSMAARAAADRVARPPPSSSTIRGS